MTHQTDIHNLPEIDVTPDCAQEPEASLPEGIVPTNLSSGRIKWIDPKVLEPHPDRPRKSNRKQRRKLKSSLRRHGCLRPVLIARGSIIICGHSVVEAAVELGMKAVPTIDASQLSDVELKAYMVFDNRSAEDSTWNYEILTSLFLELSDPDLDFDVESTGFDTGEIDLLLQEQASLAAEAKEEVFLPDPDAPVVTRSGDLWKLGQHLLLCGSALEVLDYHTLMGDERARMIITDPPFNVPIDGHVCGTGAIKHDDFQMASGEMNEAEFVNFLATSMTPMSEYSVAGSLHYFFMDWRHSHEIQSAAREIYDEFKNLIVWNKNNAGMGTFYRSKHELIFVYKKGGAPHINNFGLGEGGRYRTNVWDYAGVNAFRKDRLEDLVDHPTIKPTAMIADAILDVTKRKDIVLDPFCGSGTTILAAEQTGRRARCMEIDPKFIDVSIRRVHERTGLEARLADSDQSFSEVAAERLGPESSANGETPDG